MCDVECLRAFAIAHLDTCLRRYDRNLARRFTIVAFAKARACVGKSDAGCLTTDA